MNRIILLGVLFTFLFAQFQFAQLGQKWSYNNTDNYDNVIIGINQMDGDPALEIAVLYGDLNYNNYNSLEPTIVRIFDGSTGALEGSTPQLSGMSFNKNNTFLADVDGDNKFELIVAYDEGVNGTFVVCYEFGGSSDIATEGGQFVEKFSLTQNYPNPFNPTTTIEYEIQNAGIVEIKIFDELGQIVRTLVNEEKSVGEYTVIWNGKNESGSQVSSGPYFYQLNVNEFVSTKKMILLK